MNDDIYLYGLSSGNAEAVATGGGRFQFPTFAPDGQNFAFLEAPGGSIFNVITVRTDNREWRSLGTTAFSSSGTDSLCAGIVNWSPDSTKLLVDYGQPVFIFFLAGGTPNQVGGQSNTPSHFWSPSGNLLAFKEVDSSLWLANPDGSGQRPLVAEPVGDVAWNPAGLPVVAYTTTADGVGDLWIINVESGQKQQLTGGDTSRELSPAWFPGGRALAFARRGLQGQEQGIWSVSIDGSGLSQLTTTGHSLQLP
jgi:Tol biopolymer transport system component